MIGNPHLSAMFPLSAYRLVVGGVFSVPLPADPIPLLGPDGIPPGAQLIPGGEAADAG